MGAYATEPQVAPSSPTPALPAEREAHWDPAFLGLLGYLAVEYMRLPAMFPVLIPFQVGKVVLFIGLIGSLMSPARPSKTRANRYLDGTLGWFIAGCLMSALAASHLDETLNPVFVVVQWGVIYFLLRRTVVNAWRLRWFMAFYLLLNLKLAQFAIRQYSYLRAMGDTPDILSVRGVGAGATGFFGNPGDFGVAMCVAWPFALGLLLGETRKTWRFFYLVCFIAFLAAIFLCGSRGALLGACFVGAAVLAKNPRRILGIILVVAVLVAGFYYLPSANKERIQSGFHYRQDATAEIRLRLWRAAWRMFTDHPLLGVGLGNFRVEYATQYRQAPDFAWAPHSIYMQALSELGLAGTVPLVVFWFLISYTNRRTRKLLLAKGVKRNAFEFRLSIALDLALVGYLVSGAFLTVLYYPHLWIIGGLTAGLHIHAPYVPAESAAKTGREKLAADKRLAPVW